MRHLAFLSRMLAVVAFLFTGSYECHSRPLPPYPLMETRVQPSAHEEQKARDLFRLAHKENSRLEWDECLAGKAFRRAKYMVDNKTLTHKDPRTGKNPAWEMVVQCHRYRYAGENLAEGHVSAEVLHRALMQSPTHRDNLINPKHRFLGVGCYDDVCVELFAGF